MTGPLRVSLRGQPHARDLGATAEEFLAWLGGPTVIRIPGRDRSRARGVATLLHGNEPSGIRAIHAWLRSGAIPAVDLVLFVGAVEAALARPGFAHRMLPGRPDQNRCFLPPYEGLEGEVAGEALRLLRESGCEALVDLHNNTGHNPAYGVASMLDAARINLTALWADRLVHSTLRLGTLIEATEADFPGVTIECGRAGDPVADQNALAGLERFAQRERLELRHVLAPGITILDDPIRVSVRPEVTLAFADAPVRGAQLTLRGDIDHHNFELLLPGVPVGWVAPGAPWPIDARGADGRDVSRDLFVLRGALLETRRGGVPIMMTTSVEAARSDCLFYFARPHET